MADTKQRIKNAMLGLAIGDSMSWTSMFHRSLLLPAWTRRLRREMDTDSELQNVITLPMPFSLNREDYVFNMCPTDKTEWTAFTSETILKGSIDSFYNSSVKEWQVLANSKDKIKGSIAVTAALNNLSKGILPPRSGKENPHYFDDSAIIRAVPIGAVCAGNPQKAAEIAGKEASVTNSEDGIWAAQAMAAAISVICYDEEIKPAVEIACKFLPDDSWIKRVVEEVMEIAGRAASVFSVFPEIHEKIVNREYSYGNSAPENLALAFLITLMHGNDFERAVSNSFYFAKCGESLPAITGALSGALNLKLSLSEAWLDSIGTLKGISIPAFAGKNYLQIAEQISNYEG